MTQISRPRFGQLCFQCDANPVPAPRAQMLREHAAARGRAFLKSDLLCADCARRGDLEAVGVEPTRPLCR